METIKAGEREAKRQVIQGIPGSIVPNQEGWT